MDSKRYDIGMVGLGVMGRNLVLNMAEHGFSVVGIDKDPSKVQALNAECSGMDVEGVDSMEGFVHRLRSPRAVMMMVPAGPPVDAVIHEVQPYLDIGDIIIDGGNSYYKDTNIRQAALASKGIHLLGVGISGGEYGARHGPSMMPGGEQAAYERVRPIFEAIAAQADGQPCVAYLGPGSAGHYVKMVHNGLEYGLMQLIAETYDLMKRGLGLSDQDLHDIYARWNQTELSSYLIEITANIFAEIDPQTGKRLIDLILDEARQKGTGKWTSQDAMDLQVPVPTIDMAVSMRDLSMYKAQRISAEKSLGNPVRPITGDHQQVLNTLQPALYAGMITTFAQGMALLNAASRAYDYHLDLKTIASIWRGGCIIRAALLQRILQAFEKDPGLENLLLEPAFGKDVLGRVDALAQIVKTSADFGIPTPGFMTSLAYFDSFRSAWMPANLLQAQRDYFGAHTYERIDTKGVFHTEWEHGD